MTDEYQVWKASQARSWAEMVRRCSRRIEQRQLAIDELVATYDGIKAVMYNDKRPTQMEHGDDRLAAIIIQLDEMREEWLTSLMEYKECVSEFQRALRMLDGTYDELLQARYIRGLEWQQVADAMHYTVGYVRDDLATNALASLYDVMPLQYKTAIPKAI